MIDEDTPDQACSIGGCPSITEFCSYSASCPSATEHGDGVIVVGTIAAGLAQQVRRADGRILSETIAPNETAVLIPSSLLSELPEVKRLREENEKLREALGCQADTSVTGEPVSASPLQSGPEGKQVGQYGETKSDQAYQVIGTLATVGDCFNDPEVQRALDYFAEDTFDPKFLPFKIPQKDENLVTDGSGCVWCDVGLSVISVNGGKPGHETKDGVIYFCDKRQSPLEERSDEVSAAGGEAGLTHKSDCAVHNPPALPAGECDCGAEMERLRQENRELRDELRRASHGDACLCPECFRPAPPDPSDLMQGG